MSGSENVFSQVGLGRQSGTFDAPGSSVAAAILWPTSEPVSFELDRGSAYPAQDRGRNVRNHAGTGYHGVRGASGSLPGEVRFEDILDLLEMCYAGDVSPASLGGGLYGWLYPFEDGAPTLIPYSVETGTADLEESQHRVRSVLINELQLGFDDITTPGATPWTVSAETLAFDREDEALTADLATRSGLQTVQGHLTQLYLDDDATAYDALAELASSLVGFQHTATRNLTRRKYGGTDDIADAFGFSERSNATASLKVRISTSTKTDLHDAWNSAGVALGERRVRIQATGSGGRIFRLEGLAGLVAVPYDERDGERVFDVHLEWVRDDEIECSHRIYVVCGISSLEAYS